MKTCPYCSVPNLDDAVACTSCAKGLPTSSSRPDGQPQEEGDATGGLIPYKNPKALIAYYLGIFSVFPFVGIAAFVLGIMGIRDCRRNPAIRGGVHAGIGIGCGLIFTILWAALAASIIVGIATNWK